MVICIIPTSQSEYYNTNISFKNLSLRYTISTISIVDSQVSYQQLVLPLSWRVSKTTTRSTTYDIDPLSNWVMHCVEQQMQRDNIRIAVTVTDIMKNTKLLEFETNIPQVKS